MPRWVRLIHIRWNLAQYYCNANQTNNNRDRYKMPTWIRIPEWIVQSVFNPYA